MYINQYTLVSSIFLEFNSTCLHNLSQIELSLIPLPVSLFLDLMLRVTPDQFPVRTAQMREQTTLARDPAARVHNH